MVSGKNLLSIQGEIREGATTCQERVRYHLSKIRAQTQLNCFLSVYAEEALAHAQTVDAKIRENKAGRLAGLVLAVKDVLAHEGHPLQAASRILQGFVSPYSSTVVQRILNEDAIIIGRNNCDEFGMGSSNENSAFGPVLNGWDTRRVPGGSSGGSAVAVIEDMCQASLGSDTGGSVRQPASFCGALGLKPTYGRVSRHGLIAFASSFDTVGIIGKHIEDLAVILEVISGADGYDSTLSRDPVPKYLEGLASKGRRYHLCIFDGILQSPLLQDEVRTSTQELITDLKQAGHVVDEVTFPLREYILPTYYLLTTAEASSNLSRYDGVRYGSRSSQKSSPEIMMKYTRSEGFGEEVQRRIMLGTFVLSSDYHDAYYTHAQKVRRLIRDATHKLFDTYDLVLMPTSPTTAFPLGHHTKNPLEMYLADMFSVQANVAGIPALSVPFGKDRNGLPIGMQLMANDFGEGKLLDMGSQIMNRT